MRQSIRDLADFDGVESLKGQVSDAEWQARVDLAALYRLVALHGWDDMIYTHISCRVPDEEGHFLINPWGMLFDEITASSLVKIDMEGNPVNETPYIVNPAGFTIHSALHEAREDAHCVIHLHTDDGIAVSAQKDGLLPLSQHAMICHGRVGYHDYEGVALNHDEKQRIIADLGDKPLLILRNHGTLAVGMDCGTAYQGMFYLEKACTAQIRAQNSDKLNLCDEATSELTAQQSEAIFNGLAGALAWPGLLRKLDRLDPSFRD
ncbi:MAG: class II aldolase/adducin family protein [Parvibaculales bacterium]